ncbi:hypothetical protein C7M84_011138 [Penaeus vannamei]|uniref:Uncharacterized protein n=1 Tax=Penaeus vannamei TaxID=6689 RepID=A0A3R7PFY4_PENVA|nr:hypothetical protein C7M84_011138 [Penaeus vannamei]
MLGMYYWQNPTAAAAMVCIPCIVVPVLLFIWHRFLQPIFLKLWNPWGKVTDGTDKKTDDKDGKSACPASNGTATANGSLSCPFSGKAATPADGQSEEGDKKND